MISTTASLITRLRLARETYGDHSVLAHILHDAEARIVELEADNAALIGANLAYIERLQRQACPDCGGRGGRTPTGVYYCNCEDK